MLTNLLLALSIRFFLFDFILFKKPRTFLKERYYVFRKLFSCTFCQGFWCGLVLSIVKSWPQISWFNLEFAFIAAFLSFTWTVALDPLIRQFEQHCDLPMT